MRLASFLTLVSLAAASAFAGEATAPDLREKRAWVNEVEQGDYFFWERFFFRLDNPREFPLPPDWYRPAEIVEGEPSTPLRVRSPAERRLSATAIASIEAYLQPRETGAFFVMQGGEIDYQSFGQSLGTRIHPGSLLAVRSLSKILPALLAGIALDEKVIASLDDPIGRYLQEWRDDPRGRITVRQLLTMTSGLESVPIRWEPGNKNLRLAEGSDVRAAALAYSRVNEPDVTWAVNNADTQLLAMVVERATGRRFAEYLSEKIWRPMGLSAATLNLDGKRGNARAYCCMRAQGGDWLKIGAMMMHDGVWNGRRILPAGWMKTMLAPGKVNPYAGMHLLLGWGPGQPRPAAPLPPYTEPYHANGVFYMNGGFSIGLWMVPQLDVVLLRWGNDTPDWDNTRVPNLVIDDLRRGTLQSRSATISRSR